ncbi:hypothetical protein GGS26DRAFT_84965 [Hypomontagnella submonticulosa]|nr:hypothetical protein GGS26DRAFT_84965 [Hypomontagnella submonticulosa]
MSEIAAESLPNNHPQNHITAIAQKYDMKGIWYLDLWPIADPQVILTQPELIDAVQVTRVYNQVQHRLAQETLALGDDVVAPVNGPVWKTVQCNGLGTTATSRQALSALVRLGYTN